MKTKTIRLDRIRVDESAQTRAEISAAVVKEYAEAMGDGAQFPPVVVYSDGKINWLADGFHRFYAAREAGLKELPADIRTGGQRDAMLHAAGANATHGLRRTNADKRAAVMLLLADPEWSQWSNREIAKHCGVTHPFVAKLRGGNGYQDDFDDRLAAAVAAMPPVHPAAEIIDMWMGMEPDAFRAFVASVAMAGVLTPIVMKDGAIVDGRLRWIACRMLGRDCPSTELADRESPLAYVQAVNVCRGHWDGAKEIIRERVVSALLAEVAEAEAESASKAASDRAAELRIVLGHQLIEAHRVLTIEDWRRVLKVSQISESDAKVYMELARKAAP